MPDNKTDLELRLKATGGKEAAAEVEAVADAVQAVGTASAETTGEVLDELDAKTLAKEADENWLEAMREVISGQGDQQAATEQTIKALQKYAPMLDQVVPGLGRLIGMGSRFGPWGVALAAAAAVGWTGMRTLLEHLAEVEAAGKRGFPDMASTSAAAASGIDSVAKAAEAAANRADDAEGAFARYASTLGKIADQQAALTDADLGAALAQIDLDLIEGNLTEAEAIEAKFAARREAEVRKRADRLAALEQEYQNRLMENTRLGEDSRKATGLNSDAAKAQSDLDFLTSRGASTLPQLRDQTDARNAATKARADAEGKITDPEQLDALDAAITETQQALADAYAALVADAREARDQAVKAAQEVADRFQRGRDDQKRLEGEIGNLTTGPAAQTEAARDREADLRRRAELARLAAEQKKQDDAATAKAAQEAERAAAANSQEVDKSAMGLAKNIEAQVAAAPNAGGNPELIAALSGIATALGDGTNAAELAAVSQQILALTASLGSEQVAARSVVSQLQSQVQTLAAQLKNNRPGQ